MQIFVTLYILMFIARCDLKTYTVVAHSYSAFTLLEKREKKFIYIYVQVETLFFFFVSFDHHHYGVPCNSIH